MKKIMLIAAMFGILATATAQEDKGQNDVAPASEEISRIKLASDLAKYGYETYSATALIEAARIMGEVSTQDLECESFEASQGEKEDKDEMAPELSFESLIASASEFADGDEALMGMIDMLEADFGDSDRGRVGGPSRTVERVSSNDVDIYHIRFRGGEPAEIFVSGDGDTDLDLYVYDENGNLIESDTDYSDDCYVKWFPRWTGVFKVRIKNLGNVYNEYLMLTN